MHEKVAYSDVRCARADHHKYLRSENTLRLQKAVGRLPLKVTEDSRNKGKDILFRKF